MVSVSANGVALQAGLTNSVTASPPPTFTCTFENDGQNTEHNVVVKVTVLGTTVTGQAIVPETVPGHTYTAQVTLSSPPPTGSYTVKATIEHVPGEKVFTHNTQTFTVAFH
jgi:archaellum component FlaF (FlaF/FlaG flagellin family)